MPVVGNVKQVNWGARTTPPVESESAPVVGPAAGPTGPTGPMKVTPELPVTPPVKKARRR